ncbi:NADH-quinone oxidoreductase subunit J [bacterium]|nr:NADH-quinone oxidoreductase subunit J [bacterium]
MIWIIFTVLTIGLIACSILVIIQKNPLHSALFLILALLFLAGYYLLLNAEFVAFVHIIIYAGAIMVLFLFVIMLLDVRSDVGTFIVGTQRRIIAVLLGMLVFAFIALMLLPDTQSPTRDNGATQAIVLELGQDNIQRVGFLLYSRYLVPFEIASVLLLVAMIGAVVLAKKDAN